MQKDMRQLVETITTAKQEKRQAEHELLSLVLNFEGSLREALAIGIVRLNFSAPPDFLRSLRSEIKQTSSPFRNPLTPQSMGFLMPALCALPAMVIPAQTISARITSV